MGNMSSYVQEKYFVTRYEQGLQVGQGSKTWI